MASIVGASKSSRMRASLWRRGPPPRPWHVTLRNHLQPVEQSRILYEQAKEPRRFELLPTGNLPHLESPVLVAEVLTAWLGSLDD